MKNIVKAFVLGTFLWGSAASATEINYGQINNGVYENDYFKMSLNIPPSWQVQSRAAIAEIAETGGDLLAGENNNLKALIKESEKQTVNLFSFFKFEQGAPVDFNPSVMAVAERVTHAPGVKRGSDYLFHVKKLLKSSQLEYSFEQDVYTEVVSSVSFDVLPAKIAVGEQIVYQEYYATRINDYVLGFVTSYSNNSELKELKDIISTVKFD